MSPSWFLTPSARTPDNGGGGLVPFFLRGPYKSGCFFRKGRVSPGLDAFWRPAAPDFPDRGSGLSLLKNSRMSSGFYCTPLSASTHASVLYTVLKIVCLTCLPDEPILAEASSDSLLPLRLRAQTSQSLTLYCIVIQTYSSSVIRKLPDSRPPSVHVL